MLRSICSMKNSYKSQLAAETSMAPGNPLSYKLSIGICIGNLYRFEMHIISHRMAVKHAKQDTKLVSMPFVYYILMACILTSLSSYLYQFNGVILIAPVSEGTCI